MTTATATRERASAPAVQRQQPAQPPRGQAPAKAEPTQVAPKTLGEALKERENQFKAALPAHIPLERFMRVVMTAIQRNADLAQADRTSLFLSAIQAAQDGLLPDGREGALVIYNSKIKEGGREFWIKMVQWMPMIAGIRKKVRNSGEIVSWNAHVVHENDAFEYELGDSPFIKHKPLLRGEPGEVIAAYSIATLKGGEKTFEVMSRAQLDKVRNASKSRDTGPWNSWYEEMCRKAVARRHSKVLPMSTDLDDLIRRDDALYDLEGAREQARLANGGRPQSLADRLDMLAGAAGREDAPLVDRGTPQQDAEPADTDGADDPAESDTSAPSTQVEPENPARSALMDSLRRKAERGTNALRLGIKGLKDSDNELLTDEDHDALGEIAERADAEADAS